MGLEVLTSDEIEEADLEIRNYDERVCENNIIVKLSNQRDARMWANDFLKNYIIPEYGRDNAEKFIPVAGYHDNGEVWLVFDEKNSEQVKDYLSKC